MNFATPRTPLDDAKGSRNKKLLKDAGAMTSNEIRKNIIYQHMMILIAKLMEKMIWIY